MKDFVKYIVLSSLLVVIFAQYALALDPSYVVAFGAEDTPGRVYDANTDTTTFTYTVIGQGAHPDEYYNLRLKAFKIEVAVCEPELTISGFSPDLPENENPFFFAGPNPALLEPLDDPTGINFAGLLWKGWHGNGTLPVLLNPDEQRSFSITFAGNIEIGPISAGTALISNETGEFEPALHAVPGGSCDTVCEDRQVFDFNDLTPGDLVSDQYADRGLSISGIGDNPQQLDVVGVFDTAAPLASEADLGTPNEFYSGPGKPLLDAVSGAGVGNSNGQEGALILPICFEEEQQEPRVLSLDTENVACGASTGTIIFNFASPADVVSLSFIDIEDEGTRVVGKKDGSTVYSINISPIGNNSFQVVPLTDINEQVDSLEVELSGPAAIDDLVVCLEEPTPTPTPTPTATPTPTPTPECGVQSIRRQQTRLDGNARSQSLRLKRLAKRLRRQAKNKKQRRYARGIMQEARALYLSAWKVTWSISSEYTECEGVTQACVTSNDYGVATNRYLGFSSRFVELAGAVNARLRKVRGGTLKPRDIALEKSITSFDEDNSAQVNLIPGSTLVCPELF